MPARLRERGDTRSRGRRRYADMSTFAPGERFVSAGRLPAAGHHPGPGRGGPQAVPRRSTTGRSPAVYPALASADPGLFGLSVVSTAGDLVVGRGRPRPVPGHERDQAVRLRPRLRAARCRARTPPRRGQRHRDGVQLDRPRGAGSAGRTNPMVNAGAIATTSLRARARRRGALGDGPRRACPGSRDDGSTSTRRPSRSALRQQPPQPRARQHAGRRGSGGGRSRRRRRGLHPAELPLRHGRRPRGHGRDPGRRRDQPGDRRCRWSTRRSRTPRWP